MTHWTMTDMDGTDPLTLCEEHALSATNEANQIQQLQAQPFGSMSEAALLIDTLSAMAGIESPLTESSDGPCEACVEEQA